ncbi:MAG: glycosyltransferase family 2 protein, partial [Candidatus Kariarchaeaceae archaeon]
MNENPKVTVYIPIYNYAKYADKAIKSVLNQTFKDWELIVINDGSTDESEHLLRKYEHHPNITTVNQENKGLLVTCNIALRLAKGKYIMRLDGDDYLDENALIVMVNFLEENREVGLVYSDYYLINEHDEILSIERRENINDEDEGWILDLPPHGACTMFRRFILNELGGYDEELTCQDGYDIWFRFLESYKPGNVNLPLFYYRQHGNNLTNNHRKILEARQKVKRRFVELKKKYSQKKKSKRIAIIPVRSHSNVVSKLALKKLAGQPLINYTIDEALKSRSFDRIVVVSEDDEILMYVEQHFENILTIKRPIEYARRNTGLEKTGEMVLNKLQEEKGENYEEAMLLFVQAPLKRSEHILKAIDTRNI